MKSPIKLTWKTELLPIITIALSFVLSFYFYARMPEMVPTHWGVNGVANGWSSRAFGAFFVPCLIIGMYGLFLFLPNLDPKKDRYQEFEAVYHRFKAFMLLFMLAVFIGTGLAGIGINIQIDRFISFFVGVLFVFIGYQLKDIKPNWFMGIRTPWTMSSDYVWQETHRVGGIIFMIAGVIMALSGWLPIAWRVPAFIATMILLLAGTILYSYYVYWQENKKK